MKAGSSINVDGPARPWQSTDRIVCGLVFLLLLGGALWTNWPVPAVQNAKFGWEYGNTAEALIEGRGFADPFEGVKSGPTAWMPPLYVFLMVGVFAVFGVKSAASMWVLLVLKYAGLALALGVLLRLADITGLGRHRWWMLVAFLGALCINRQSTFLTLHDPWLHLLLSCLLLLALVSWHARPTQPPFLLWLLALLLPLTSPSLALAFALLVIWRALTVARRPRELFVCAALLAVFAGSAGVWTARNLAVFGALIPVKSNLWFDLVQANEYDDDGLVTNLTFLMYNPSNSNPNQDRYVASGEAAFTHAYRQAAMELIASHPARLLRRVARRARSAFLFLHDQDDVRPVSSGVFDPPGLERARRAGLVMKDWSGDWVWLCLPWPESRFVSTLRRAEGSVDDRVLRDWRRAREDVWDPFGSWLALAKVVRTLVISTVPTIFLVFGLANRGIRSSPVFALAAAIYVIHLAPYVLVSHYMRYQTPMIGLQAVFAFFAAATILRVRVRTAPQPGRPCSEARTPVPGIPQV